MSTPEIDRIVDRILAGDLDAYEAIVRGYQREVWKVAAAMLLTREKTEDLVQQTFINGL
jgi:DNA-directed RNA polymerase specialized sigma24 family protein